jgi:hypothetical protein
MYSWDMVTAQTAGQGTGIRLCTCNMALGSPAACDTPAEWTCGWAAKSVRLNQVKLTVINSTQPAILWRDELNGRMVLTYCTGVASTCTGTPPGSDGGYWMHSFLARIATAQGTDRFSISSQWDHLFGEDIYITYMNRGTLYLAEASTTTSLIFDSRTWTTVPLVFDPNLLGPASNSGALRYLYATDSVFLPYAIYNPVTGDVTVKVLLKGSTKRYAGQ